MNLDVTDTGFPAPDGELPVEVPRFVRRAVHRGEDEPVLLPGLVRAITVGGLLLGAELEGGYADVRKRQYSGRAWRFSLTVTKLMVGPLYAFPEAVRVGYEAADHTADDRTGLLTLGMNHYTESGIVGRPSLASAAKGKAVIASLVNGFADCLHMITGER